MSGPRNTLRDLNNHLFEQLERLNDTSLKGEKLNEEIERSKSITSIAKNIIENGKLVLDAQRFNDDKHDINSKLPRMLGAGNSE